LYERQETAALDAGRRTDAVRRIDGSGHLAGKQTADFAAECPRSDGAGFLGEGDRVRVVAAAKAAAR